MKKAIQWMVDNPVSANLLLVFIIGFGILQALSIKKEVFPEYSLDMISVTVPYRGATPTDVEEAICTRIEEEISGLDGIKRITSTAREGIGTVLVEVQKGYDTKKLRDDVKSAVDRITNFPKDIDLPVVTEVSRKREVLKVVLYGDVGERDLKRAGERLRDDLASLKGISLVTLNAVRPYEVSIEVPEKMLEKYNLTLPRIAAIVAENCRDIPAGKIRQKGEEILVRTKGLKYTRKDFMDIPVVRDPAGGYVRLSDIANIVDGFEETDAATYFDGRLAILLKVYRIGEQSALDIEKVVKGQLPRLSKTLPNGIHLQITNNRAEILRDRLNLLFRNGKYGLILVVLLLAMFLELRLALWVAMGIPVAFFGSFILLPYFGVSVNMVSLFAFIICLGIVVDDAIIVGEHIFTKIQNGVPRKQAAVDGAYEMAAPVILTVLTTIAAFLPLLFVTGIMGKFMFAIPVVVISVLSISLVEAIFILPAHLAHLKERKESHIVRFLPKYFDRWLDLFIEKIYQPILRWALAWRWTAVALGILMFCLMVGYVASGRIKIVFFTKVDADFVIAEVKLPEGASADQTLRVVKRMALSAEKVQDYYKRHYGAPIVKHVSLTVASQPYGSRHEAVRSTSPNMGEVAIELVAAKDRKGVNSNDVANVWRRLTGEIPGVESITYNANLFSGGAAIDIQLSSDNFEQLKQASARLKEELAWFNGVKDIHDNIEGGKQEINLKLTARGKALGLNLIDLGLQVRGAFYGTEAVRIQRGKDDVRIMVRYPAAGRVSLLDLERMEIETSRGVRLPLPEVATWTIKPGYSVITRSDRRRVVDVKADVVRSVANADEIIKELQGGFLERLKADYPGLNYSLEGEEKERRDSMRSMMYGFLVALFLIFVLLAIPFNSYIQPLVIMMAIPFGMIGAVLGHLLLGYNLSIVSFFGIVALTGVLVNDSLVLLDAINKQTTAGAINKVEAVVAASKSRFRPVILTSLTTFGGLLPMITETSVQARVLIPMAISLGFGVLFATGITLILIPALYMMISRKDALPNQV